MRKSLGLIFAAFIIVCGLSVVSFAQNGNRQRAGVNQRQQNQRERIKEGVKSGELTRNETARLANEQRQINRLEDRFRDSGDGLTNTERARIARQQNQANRHILRQTHDRQDRP